MSLSDDQTRLLVEAVTEKLDQYKEVYNKIKDDETWLKAIEGGKVRPGHPEGKIKYHIENIEKYLDDHQNQVNEMDYWRLKIMALVHDAFKSETNSKIPILDPNSHASLGAAYAHKFINDPDMETMLLYHDYPFSLWRRSTQGKDVTAKIAEFLPKIKNKKVFDLFMTADGSGPGKDAEPMNWWMKVSKS